MTRSAAPYAEPLFTGSGGETGDDDWIDAFVRRMSRTGEAGRRGARVADAHRVTGGSRRSGGRGTGPATRAGDDDDLVRSETAAFARFVPAGALERYFDAEPAVAAIRREPTAGKAATEPQFRLAPR